MYQTEERFKFGLITCTLCHVTLIVYPICIRGCAHIRHTAYSINLDLATSPLSERDNIATYSTNSIALRITYALINIPRGRTQHAQMNIKNDVVIYQTLLISSYTYLIAFFSSWLQVFPVRGPTFRSVHVLNISISAVSAVLYKWLWNVYTTSKIVHHCELT